MITLRVCISADVVGDGLLPVLARAGGGVALLEDAVDLLVGHPGRRGALGLAAVRGAHTQSAPRTLLPGRSGPTLSRHRRLDRCVFDGRHGALRRTGRGRGSSVAAAPRSRGDHDDT